MDEDLAELWTASAAEAYRRQATELVAAVQHHLRLTLGREGQDVESQPYLDSCEDLRHAVEAFSEAEFDWCGSAPLALQDDWDEDEDEDEDFEVDDDLEEDGGEEYDDLEEDGGEEYDQEYDEEYDEGEESGDCEGTDEPTDDGHEADGNGTGVLSVLGRWDFNITDADALMAAGRQASRTERPDDADQDVDARIGDAGQAALELVHVGGMSALLEAPGLEHDRDITIAVVHEAEDQEAFEDDPFGVVGSA
jgi:hypothetical protein